MNRSPFRLGGWPSADSNLSQCPVILDVMLRGVDRTAEAVNTLPWLERWTLDVGLKSDFSDEK